MKTENKNISTLTEHLDNRYGKVGTQTRATFEAKATAVAISDLRKDLIKKYL